MWPRSDLTSLLGIEHPLIQAPMAGGYSTPELAAAVSNAGGLGSLGCGYLSAAQLRDAIRAVRARTSRPFGVNLFTFPQPGVSTAEVEAMRAQLAPLYAELGLAVPTVPAKLSEPFEEQLAVVLEERVPIFSFTFGMPSADAMRRLKEAGIRVLGTATTVAEGRALVEAGVDAVVAQGMEAGGHRGSFLRPEAESLVGTMALVPLLADAVRVPVIASGGIMDARGVVAALALGASGVQMGTAFLTCRESGASAAHRQAIVRAEDTSTALTRAFSGRMVRGFPNRLSAVAGAAPAVPPYPVQHALTQPLRRAAGTQGRSELQGLWAGQAAGLAREVGAAELVAELARESAVLMGWLGRGRPG